MELQQCAPSLGKDADIQYQEAEHFVSNCLLLRETSHAAHTVLPCMYAPHLQQRFLCIYGMRTRKATDEPIHTVEFR